MKTIAQLYIDTGLDANSLMTALDNEDVQSDQDWDNEATTWTFGDNSTLTISGSEITAGKDKPS